MAAALALPNEQPVTVPDVYRGICQVAKAISRDGIGKASRNQQQGYSFRGIDDIMNALSALLAGADMCILPRMLSRNQEERTTAKGGVLFYVTVQADFDIVSCRDGSRHTVTMFGEAMDSADKATNKAMSAAYKYACLQAFCIPTEGMMPDADSVTHQPAPRAPMPIRPPQPAAVIATQIPEAHEAEVTYEEVDMDPEEKSQLERELAESIEMVERRKAMLEGFRIMKGRYRAINALKTFYAILGIHGQQEAEGFANTVEGHQNAVACFADLRADVMAREARMR
jgi:ERF superfamily